MRLVNYRPQRSCGKVIFSQASVSHSVHGGGRIPACTRWSVSQHASGGVAHPSDRHPRGRHPPGQTSPKSIPPLGRHPSPRESTPPPAATAADGTHTTGMLSFFSYFFGIYFNNKTGVYKFCSYSSFSHLVQNCQISQKWQIQGLPSKRLDLVITDSRVQYSFNYASLTCAR